MDHIYILNTNREAKQENLVQFYPTPITVQMNNALTNPYRGRFGSIFCGCFTICLGDCLFETGFLSFREVE